MNIVISGLTEEQYELVDSFAQEMIKEAEPPPKQTLASKLVDLGVNSVVYGSILKSDSNDECVNRFIKSGSAIGVVEHFLRRAKKCGIGASARLSNGCTEIIISFWDEEDEQ